MFGISKHEKPRDSTAKIASGKNQFVFQAKTVDWGTSGDKEEVLPLSESLVLFREPPDLLLLLREPPDLLLLLVPAPLALLLL